MYVLSRFSFNVKYLTRTYVHVQVGYYMGSAIEIPKVHYSKVMVYLYEMLCKQLLSLTMRIIICFTFYFMFFTLLLYDKSADILTFKCIFLKSILANLYFSRYSQILPSACHLYHFFPFLYPEILPASNA